MGSFAHPHIGFTYGIIGTAIRGHPVIYLAASPPIRQAYDGNRILVSIQGAFS
jgi:hypothetical protein